MKKTSTASNAEIEKVLTGLSKGLNKVLAPTITKGANKKVMNSAPKTNQTSGDPSRNGQANVPLLSTMQNGDVKPAKPRLADLLDEIDRLILKYVNLPNVALAVLIAVWLAGACAHKKFRVFGYLALRSATPRCGKSTLLKIIGQLIKGCSPITTIPTAAILYRATWAMLLLDELDKLRNVDKEKYGEVLAVLNAGYEDGGAVLRCNSKTHTVEQYPVFYPKALAGIESIADTLSDRSFQVQMERSAQRMPRLNLRKMSDLFTRLREGLQQWVDEHAEVIVQAYDALPDQLDCLESFDDRFQDISEPLIVIATLADAERPEGPQLLPRLLEGLKSASGRREPSGREKQLIEFLGIAAEKLGGAEEKFIPSVELVAACSKIEDLAFIETPKKLSGLLKHFDLIPKSNGSERGYNLTREWVETWTNRYPKPNP